jgi:hypothetical protein
MRYRIFFSLVLALAGCALDGGVEQKHAVMENPIAGGEISVTSLDSGVKPSADNPQKVQKSPTTVKPMPDAVEVGASIPVTAHETEQPEPIAPEVLTCMKQGGEWITAGAEGAKACIHRTRDSGKSCRKKGDCEGDCLSKSNSCAPITPLFGCNDILQENGVMVTLCID